MDSHQRIILEQPALEVVIQRMCYELLERHSDISKVALIGMQPRGVPVARHIQRIMNTLLPTPLLYGELDTTFYRDDFRRGKELHTPYAMNIGFNTEGMNIVLVDDVLYTGRSVRAALDALNDFGRPNKVELMVLIDRRYSRELPISPDYTGLVVDTRAQDKVKVQWAEDGSGQVWITPSNDSTTR